jgi:hypothetical protein
MFIAARLRVKPTRAAFTALSCTLAISCASCSDGHQAAHSTGVTESTATANPVGVGPAATLRYGHSPGGVEARAIDILVGRYLTAAVKGDGTTACASMYSLYKESIVQDYGQSSGPPSLRGSTCAIVMSKLFRQERSHTESLGDLHVAATRIRGLRAIVLLAASGQPPTHSISLHRERSTWGIDELLDVPVP